MRKFLFSSALFILSAVFCFADNDFYKPTDKWPYVFDSFRKGVIHFEAPYPDLEAEINICVVDGHLHYLENGVILESTAKGVTGAEVDGKVYRCFRGRMLEVVVADEKGFVGKVPLYDTSGQGGVDIGFGITTSNYAAADSDIRAVSALGQSFIHAKVAEMAQKKDEGIPMPLKDVVYIVAGNKGIEAFRQDFVDLVGKEAASAFLKANKVKWNNPLTLLPVADYLASLPE